MKLSFDYDLEDYKLLLRYLLDTSPIYRRIKLRLRLLFPIGLLLLAAALVTRTYGSGEVSGYYAAAPLAALGVALAAFYPRWYNHRVMKIAVRQTKGEDNRNVFGTRQVELTPEGVRSVSRMGEMFYRAGAILRVVVTPDLLLLFVAPMQAIIFPRTKIPPEEFDKAAAFAKACYGAADQ